jgi:hypothetical protein
MLSNLDKADRILVAIQRMRLNLDLVERHKVIFDVLEACDRGQTELFFAIEEGERQMTMLALAELSLSRPGWKNAIDEIAKKMHGFEMYEGFRVTSSDRVKETHKSLGQREIAEK